MCFAISASQSSSSEITTGRGKKISTTSFGSGGGGDYLSTTLERRISKEEYLSTTLERRLSKDKSEALGTYVLNRKINLLL